MSTLIALNRLFTQPLFNAPHVGDIKFKQQAWNMKIEF